MTPLSKQTLSIRPLAQADNPAVQKIIETVMPEFGADQPGFALFDPEVKDMYRAYSQPRCCYFVVCDADDFVHGGAGVGPLQGGDKDVCELKKMYFKKELRGLGWGHKLLTACLDQAKKMGYRRCYLETLERMDSARRAYQRAGFVTLAEPWGQTGHFGCDHWMAKDL